MHLVTHNVFLYLLLHQLFFPRMAPFDGSAWEEEDDEAAPPPDVPYYNNFPGKQPPPGGLIDMRTRPGATLVRNEYINTTAEQDTHTPFNTS